MVTPRFAVGDLIRCINRGDQLSLTYHKVYKVIPTTGVTNGMTRIIDDNDEPARYFTYRFELARNRPPTIRSAWNTTEAEKP